MAGYRRKSAGGKDSSYPYRKSRRHRRRLCFVLEGRIWTHWRRAGLSIEGHREGPSPPIPERHQKERLSKSLDRLGKFPFLRKSNKRSARPSYVADGEEDRLASFKQAVPAPCRTALLRLLLAPQNCPSTLSDQAPTSPKRPAMIRIKLGVALGALGGVCQAKAH